MRVMARDWYRRMISVALLIILLFQFSVADAAGTGDGNEMSIIRERFIEDIIGDIPAERTVRELIERQNEDGTWPGINYTDVSRTGFEHRIHLENMLLMSRAYAHRDSAFHGDRRLRDALMSALDYWLANDFISDNWWWNEMGTPRLLSRTLLLIDGELSDEQRAAGVRIASRASLEGFGARPGGDLIQIAGIMGKRALLENNSDDIKKAVNAMTTQVRIGSGRGLQPDLSLQHRTDRVTSTLTYGYGFASSYADYALKLKDTSYMFSEGTLKLMIDFYLDGIHKSTALGRYRDPPQLNRGITRRSPQRPLSAAVPRALAAVSDYRRGELEKLVAVREGRQEPRFSFNKYFWSSEYFTHQRPHYFASVRMYSTRNHSVEVPYNEEGLRNHYLADGSNFLTRKGNEYNEIMPVYDWRKIPGTTVVQKPGMPRPGIIQQRGRTDFVGGVSDGMFGAAVFDFRSPIDDLQAKKAWFFFDLEYVCLGNSIVSDEDHPVATTVSQVALHGDVAVGVDGGAMVMERGEHDLSNAGWVWHDGTAVMFPPSTPIRMKNTTATGSWRAINRQHWATSEEVVRDVFTLWIDHGKRPRDGKYAYVVVPGIRIEDVPAYRRNPAVRVIANNSAVQAVIHRELQLCQIVFYEPGEISISDELHVEAKEPGLVMVRTSGDHITNITVADPSRKHESFNLDISARIEGGGDGWSAQWDAARGRSEIRIDLPANELAGKPIAITLP